MTKPVSLLLALRFSRGRRRSGMVSLISFLSTAGIAIGVAVLIIGLSAMNGFQRELTHRILDIVPQGEIIPVDQSLTQWQSWINQAVQVKGVTAAAPFIRFTGLADSGNKLQALQIRGIDPALEPAISALPNYIARQNWQGFRAGQQQIILGSGLAKNLGVTTGDSITLLIPRHENSKNLSEPSRIRVKIAGLLQLSGMLDHSLALVPLADAQQYLTMGSSVTGIALKMANPFQAQTIIRAAGEAIHQYVYINTWIGNYGYMYRDIQMIRAIMYLAMILVIGVASFNIISTLVMAVKDKQSDIAILRTIGANNRLIRGIFIWYGLLTGLLGSVVGVFLGVIIAENLTSFTRMIEKWTGHHFLAGDIYFIDFLPSQLHWLDVIFVFCTAIVLSLLASWYPARRASHISPAAVLNG